MCLRDAYAPQVLACTSRETSVGAYPGLRRRKVSTHSDSLRAGCFPSRSQSPQLSEEEADEEDEETEPSDC